MPESFVPPHGDYQKLLSCRKSEILRDATVYFCNRVEIPRKGPIGPHFE